MALSTFGLGTSSQASSRSVRCSTSRTECRYSSSFVRSSLPSARRSDLASSSTASSTLRRLVEAGALGGDAAGFLAEQAVEDVRGLSSAGSGTPSREKARVVELFGWPGAGGDGKFQRGEARLLREVTSAIS
jgi:hypothetical protein